MFFWRTPIAGLNIVCKGVQVKSVIGNRLGTELDNGQIWLHILGKFVAIHAQIAWCILCAYKAWNNDHQGLPRTVLINQVAERVWLKDKVVMTA